MARAALEAASRAERPAPRPPVGGLEAPELEALAERVTRVRGAWETAASYYDREIAPIERVLRRYGADTPKAQRIALSLVREAKAVDLEPRLLLAVLLVENPWLDPDIRSSVGAIGLMQVMPMHRGGWSMCGPDLEDVEDNICHGANIFAHYFRMSRGNVDVALLRYNGCVNGTNTPNCHQYPTHVFARAGRASVLAWLGQGPVAASP
ncbi:MAG: transglycosylase SLT domain-containing protein [Gemmatimonadota bacterium]